MKALLQPSSCPSFFDCPVPGQMFQQVHRIVHDVEGMLHAQVVSEHDPNVAQSGAFSRIEGARRDRHHRHPCARVV